MLNSHYSKEVFVVFIVECININYSKRHTIIELSSNEQPYGLTITQSRVYWTDWK